MAASLLELERPARSSTLGTAAWAPGRESRANFAVHAVMDDKSCNREYGRIFETDVDMCFFCNLTSILPCKYLSCFFISSLQRANLLDIVMIPAMMLLGLYLIVAVICADIGDKSCNREHCASFETGVDMCFCAT